MQKSILTIFILLSCCTLAWADAIGSWKIYPSAGTSFSQAVLLNEKVFYLSGNVLYAADTTQLTTVTQYNRTNGLNDSGITAIVASSSASVLGIVYSNSNIDLMNQEGEVYNLPDLKEKTITGDKTINSVLEQDGIMYVNTGYGFVTIDLVKKVFLNTYMLGISVDAAFKVDNTLYVLSDNQFYYQEESLANGKLSAWNGPIANNNQFDAYLYQSDALANEYAATIIANTETIGPMGTSTAKMAVVDGKLVTISSLYYPAIYKGWGSLLGNISMLDLATETWTYVSANKLYNTLPDSLRTDLNHLYSPWALVPDKDNRDKFYISSGVSGIHVVQGDSITMLYNSQTADGLDAMADVPSYTRVGAIYQDNDGYLWVANCCTEGAILRSMSPTGKWTQYPITDFTNVGGWDYGFTNTILQAENDGNYYLKWLCSPYPTNKSQMAIYYDKCTPEETSDDQSIMFDGIIDQDGNSYSPIFYDVAEDKDGAIWLVTDQGPFIIPDPVYCFNHASASSTLNKGYAERIKIPRNDGTNLADYLLPNVEIVCVFIDPANCKWFGTKSDGLYRISADGLTQLEHFTSENSPLFGDLIFGLTFDKETGTLYIATEGGICAYQTDAQPSASDWNSLYCYPNPVRPEFSGNLTICGLQDECTVVITDINNHAIFKGTAQCGVMTWDLCGNGGKRVKPGIYLIHAVDESGKEGATFKFLVL